MDPAVSHLDVLEPGVSYVMETKRNTYLFAKTMAARVLCCDLRVSDIQAGH